MIDSKGPGHISSIAAFSEPFKAELERAKQAAAAASFAWYPYDSLSNFPLVDRLLQADNRDFSSLVEGRPILDLGCADGANAFFLERLGFEVDAIDHAPTNFNNMRGVRTLKAAGNSGIGIHEVDLDSQFRLPRDRYGLVLFFGLLYHLKNPFYVLETLALQARFCLLSTRVARFGPDRQRLLHDLPVAYLVAPHETNNDSTNYWIFSRTGLERLFSRTGWRMRQYLSVGNVENSDPASQDGDERAFCLLESEREESARSQAPPDKRSKLRQTLNNFFG